MKGCKLTCFVSMGLFLLFLIVAPQGIAKEREVVIGYIGPLTGGAAFLGVDALNGALIAAEDINTAGGIDVGGKNYKLRIERYDDEATPAKAVAGLRKLKDRFDIPVVICDISGSAIAITEINQRLKVLWTGFATHPDITAKGNNLVLRSYPASGPTTALAVEGVVEVLKAKNFVVLSDAGDYGRAQEGQFRTQLEAKGVKHLATEWFDQRKDSDFRVLITKIKPLNPDAIVICAYDEPTGQIVKQMREMGLKTRTVTSTGFQTKGIAIAGWENLEGGFGVTGPTGFEPVPQSLMDYRVKYKKVFSGIPASYGENNYELVIAIARGMEKAGSVSDPYKIKTGMMAAVPVAKANRTAWIEKWEDNGEVTLWQKGILFKGSKRLDKYGKALTPPAY
jgi:branched-chain amino acid transport system substrate-binding protein